MSFLDDMKKAAEETKAAQNAASQDWKERTLTQASAEIDRILETLQSDIEKDARAEARGYLAYHLLTGWMRLLFAKNIHYPITEADIDSLPAYGKLKAHCASLGVTMRLRIPSVGCFGPEIRIEGWGGG
jgi:hypothetical protein